MPQLLAASQCTEGGALTDSAYSLPDAQAEKGLSWLHRWMIAAGRRMRPEPKEPEFITKLFAANPRP